MLKFKDPFAEELSPIVDSCRGLDAIPEEAVFAAAGLTVDGQSYAVHARDRLVDAVCARLLSDADRQEMASHLIAVLLERPANDDPVMSLQFTAIEHELARAVGHAPDIRIAGSELLEVCIGHEAREVLDGRSLSMEQRRAVATRDALSPNSAPPAQSSTASVTIVAGMLEQLVADGPQGVKDQLARLAKAEQDAYGSDEGDAWPDDDELEN